MGPLRAALAAVAAELVRRRFWEPLGFARLRDYVGERLGLSGRSVQDLAHVGERLVWRPLPREALVSGRLNWTKVRLLARRPAGDDQERWIEYARGVSAATLAREVREVDQDSLEAGGHREGRVRFFRVPCSRGVAYDWSLAIRYARRVHGHHVPLSQCAEMVAAEVLSALPLDAPPGPEPGEPEPASARRDLAEPIAEEVPAPIEVPAEL